MFRFVPHKSKSKKVTVCTALQSQQTVIVVRHSLRNDKSKAVESNYVFKKLQMQDLDFSPVNSPSATYSKDGCACESLQPLEIRISALG